jgi:hypothetical protein
MLSHKHATLQLKSVEPELSPQGIHIDKRQKFQSNKLGAGAQSRGQEAQGRSMRCTTRPRGVTARTMAIMDLCTCQGLGLPAHGHRVAGERGEDRDRSGRARGDADKI